MHLIVDHLLTLMKNGMTFFFDRNNMKNQSHQQWNDYDRTRPVNLYKADDNLYTRNFRDAYEPQYIPVKTVRSNNYLDDISESRNVRDVYEPRQIPTYPSRSNNFSDVSIVPRE
ncbi:hypothetical protein KSF78_0003955 [Schistosoma japonicum]|nr:hypothetical protein KSF78_0003955 [Schistosoma japonicum]